MMPSCFARKPDGFSAGSALATLEGVLHTCTPFFPVVRDVMYTADTHARRRRSLRVPPLLAYPARSSAENRKLLSAMTGVRGLREPRPFLPQQDLRAVENPHHDGAVR